MIVQSQKDSLVRLAVVSTPACPVAHQLVASRLFDVRVWRQGQPTPLPGTSWLERCYRLVDRSLFGVRETPPPQQPEAEFDLAALRAWRPDYIACLVERQDDAELRSIAQVLTLSVQGLAVGDLDRAVRSQVGQPNGVALLAWVNGSDAGATQAFVAACALDHRSMQRSLEQVLRKCPTALLGLIRRLRQGGSWAAPVSARPEEPRSATRLLAVLIRDAFRWAVWRDQWSIRVFRRDSSALPSPKGPGALHGLTHLQPDAGSFWADPFLYRHADGKWWVFFEALPFATGRGHIAAVDLSAEALTPLTVLSESWHLSYPHLFEWQGALYMVPESSANRSVDLYRCETFPTGWRKVKCLIEGPRLADATLFFRNGRWWMLAAHGLPGASMYDELHVYWAEDLLGPWFSHALNPVRIDARNCRPAGAVFEVDERLIRPVQDCSAIYGGAVRFMEIVCLDVDKFEEREAQWPPLRLPGLEPDVPAHTFNAREELVCVDTLGSLLRCPGRLAAPGSTRASAEVH